jgi:hypothetical protein
VSKILLSDLHQEMATVRGRLGIATRYDQPELVPGYRRALTTVRAEIALRRLLAESPGITPAQVERLCAVVAEHLTTEDISDPEDALTTTA